MPHSDLKSVVSVPGFLSCVSSHKSPQTVVSVPSTHSPRRLFLFVSTLCVVSSSRSFISPLSVWSPTILLLLRLLSFSFALSFAFSLSPTSLSFLSYLSRFLFPLFFPHLSLVPTTPLISLSLSLFLIPYQQLFSNLLFPSSLRLSIYHLIARQR